MRCGGSNQDEQEGSIPGIQAWGSLKSYSGEVGFKPPFLGELGVQGVGCTHLGVQVHEG